MNELHLFGIPISLVFLYFIVYSFLGWCMETIYCSIQERHLVPRGFLYGPICPIYGGGVLMMIFWFQPLMGNPVLFYAAAMIGMSSWEYLVAWFLETTTHIKYWDYSMYKYNLKGRICLWVSLMWGVLSFVVLYFIHPLVSREIEKIPLIPRYVLDGFFLGVLVSDTTATIYQLVRTSQLLERMQQVSDELRVQVHLGKAEFSSWLEETRGKLDATWNELDEQGKSLKLRYDELVSRTERISRRFRIRYRHMRAWHASEAMESVRRRGERLKAWLEESRKK